MHRGLVLPGLLFLAACGQDLVLPGEGEPRLVSILAGDGQDGLAADPLADSLVITVTDALGRPVVRQAIAVNLLSGGSTDPTGLHTDQDGRVALRWILGPAAGPQSLEIGVGSSGTINPKTVFHATALPGPAAVIQIAGGNDQVGEAGKLLADSLSVVVKDTYGNGVPGSGITWTPVDGSVSPIHTTADASGLAQTAWTLGPDAGPQAVVAELDAMPGTTVEFDATATPGAPPVLLVLTQPSDTVQNQVPFPMQPVVQVGDQVGAPQAIPGIAVTAAIASGNGLLTGATTVSTDGAGQAHFTDLSLTGPAGPFTLIFAAPGYVAATSDTVILLPSGPNPSASTVQANPTNLTAGTGASVITVTVLDATLTPLAGIKVTLSATGGGNTLVQPSALTDAQGRTSGGFSSTVAELKTIQATAAGVVLNDHPQILVAPGPPTASGTTATVPMGHRNRVTDIVIRTGDVFDNRLTTGGYASHLSVQVTGANSATPTAVDNGDGTYLARYVPTVRGTDRIDILFDGVPISGSPYFSDVK